MLNCAHFDPGLASIVYSSACVGSTSYFVVYGEVASQGENRQGAGIREGVDQRYFTVRGDSQFLDMSQFLDKSVKYGSRVPLSRCPFLGGQILTRVSSCGPQVSSCQFLAVKAVSFWAFSLLFLGNVMSNFENFD